MSVFATPEKSRWDEVVLQPARTTAATIVSSDNLIFMMVSSCRLTTQASATAATSRGDCDPDKRALIDAFEAQRLAAIPGGAVRSKRRECFPPSLDGPRTMSELDPSAS